MSEKKLLPEIENFFEDHGFNVDLTCSEETYIELEQYTPAGEDWSISIVLGSLPTVEDLIDEIKTIYEGFDPDEEYDLLKGLKGAPRASILIEDQEWKDKTLEELSRDTDSIKYLSDWTILAQTDLSKTLEQRGFDVDKSSIETGIEDGKPYCEFCVEVWEADKTGRDFYCDVYERAELNLSIARDADYNISSIPLTFDALKKREGFENCYIDVFVKVFDDKTCSLYAKVEDNDGFAGARTVLLTDEEQKAVYDMAVQKIGEQVLEEMFSEERVRYKEEQQEEQNKVNDFLKENFYNEKDIIKTYYETAPVDELKEFLHTSSVSLRDASRLLDNTIEYMSDEAIQREVQEHAKYLFTVDIRGNKYLDSIGTPSQNKAENKAKDTVERD